MKGHRDISCTHLNLIALQCKDTIHIFLKKILLKFSLTFALSWKKQCATVCVYINKILTFY